MPVQDTSITVTPDSSGTAISGVTVTTGAGDVFVQRIVLSDDDANKIAQVSDSAPAGTEAALIVRPIPSGTQTIAGTVTAQDGGGSLTVDGTITANAGTGPFPVSDNAGSLTVDSAGLPTALGQATMAASVPVVVASDQTAVPVSGTLTIQDGGGSITVDGTVTANAGTGTFVIGDGGGTISVDDNAGSLTVDGTVTANAGTGFAPVVTDGAAAGTTGLHILGTDGTNAQILSTNASGHVNVADGGNVLSVDDAAGSLTVDGTVTANAGTGTFTVGDGGSSLTVDAPAATPVAVAITDTLNALVKPGDATNSAMRVNVVAGSTAGTEYTEGDIDASITGTAIMWEDAADTLRAVSATKPLPISDAGGSLTIDGTVTAQDGGGSLTVDGTVTANAGTGTFTVGDGGGSLTVDGTVTANAGTGFPPVVTDGAAAGTTGTHVLGTDGTNAQILSTNASGHLNVTDGGATLSVDDGAGSLTIDGTVTANAGTGTFTVGDGGGAISVDDNSSSLTVDAPAATPVAVAITTTADALVKAGDAVNNAMRVNVVAGATAGTEYTEGDIDATITGTAIMWEDAADTLRAVSTAKPLPVSDAGGSLTVDGTITANAGTGTFTVGDGGGSLTVDGTVTANAGTGFASVVTDGAAAGTTGTHVLGTDGTNAQILSTNASGHLNVADGGNVLSVDDAGASLTVDGTVTANAGTGTFTVGDGGGAISVDDNGGSITVDGTLGISGAVDTELTTADLDTGIGTDTRAVVGLVYGADGGGVLVSTTNPLPIGDNGGSLTIDGTVTANAGTGTFIVGDGGAALSVDDNGGALTVDGTVTSNAGTGFPPIATDGAAVGTTGIHVLGTDGTNAQILSTNASGHVNVADGGNILSVDDAAGSLTVDGTVTANAGTGTFIVGDGGGSLTVDGTVTANAGTGFAPVVTDGAAAGTTGLHVLGTDGTNAQIVSTNASGHINVADGGNVLSVDDAAGSLTVDGTVTANAGTGTFTVGDGGGSLTVDGTVTANAGTGTFVVGDGGGTISIDDGAGSITVDGTLGISGAVDTELTTADLDTGLGTDTRAVVGLVYGADGGGVLVSTTNPLPVGDNGGSLTIDGTVTANAGTGTFTVGDGGASISVDDNGGALTVDGTITANAGTGFASVVTDGAAAGTTGTHVLGTDGTNAQILSTNASGHVNIADGDNSITVDGTVTANAGTGTFVVGDGGGSLTVDGTLTANAGTGFAPVVTDGAAAGTTGLHVLGTDGTNAQILSTNTSGHVNIADGGNVLSVDDAAGSLTVDGTVTANAGTGTFVVGDGGGSLTVDGTVTSNAGTGFPPVVTDGAAVGTTGIHVLGTDGTNAQILSTNATGHVNIADGGNIISVDDGASTLSIDDGAGSLTVDGTVTAAAQPGVDIGDVTINNAAGASAVNIQDGGNTITVDGTVTASAQPGVDIGDVTINNAAGASAVNIQDGGNAITVDGTVTAAQATAANLNATVVGTGTFAVQATLQASTNTTEVVGDAAHNATAAGNPVRICGTSEDINTTAPGVRVSAEGNATTITTDRDGAVYSHPHPPQIWNTANEYTAQQTDATVQAAPGANLSLYITDVFLSCNAAVTVTLEEDGAPDVLKWKFYASGQGDGASVHFIVPIKLTANTALLVTTSAAVTVFLGVNGFTAA